MSFLYISLRSSFSFPFNRSEEAIVSTHAMERNEIKPARAAPPKPAPFHPQRPPPSSVPPVLPSAHTTTSNGVPPKPGRKPPPSVPPPPPPRVDLGETPGEVVSSIKEQSNDDVGKKGSPKLKYEYIFWIYQLS